MPNPHQTKMHYDGSALTLTLLYLQLILGCLVTLGIYNFWGRSKVRQYMIGSIMIRHDRYQYHGTGEELLLCFAKALIKIIIYLAINYAVLGVGIHYLGWNSDWFVGTVLVLNIIFIYTILFYAFYKSLQYRYSRISWRGIRYRMHGSAWQFAWISLSRTLLNIVTIGILLPKSTMDLYGYIVNNLHFGDQRYRLRTPSLKELMHANIISILLFIPTLGLSRIWYAATLRRQLTGHVQFMDLEFTNSTDFKGLSFLYITNLLLIICTAGIGIPLAIHRAVRYHITNLCIIGDLDRKRIVQARTANQFPLAEAIYGLE